jgi:hypothetical protein
MNTASWKGVGFALMIAVTVAVECAWCAPRAADKAATHPSVALTGIVSSESGRADGRSRC